MKHHCNWTGISCDTSNSNVVAISLVEKQLTGRLPRSLGNLSHLEVLDLSSNKFYGSIPSELGNCTKLMDLGVYNNLLSGLIPPLVFGNVRNLKFLDLRNNSFTGSIPDSITKCTFLEQLVLSSNNLTGSIPRTAMASMKSSLLYLNLSHNFLSATIPEDIGTLETLEVIDISNNDLSGTIPTALKNCKNLLVFNMSRNKLSGPLQDVFTDMKLLTSLNLSQNQINGNIPSSLASLKNLILFDLSWNQMQGEIPENFSTLPNLKHLNLSYNQLEGPVPQFGIFKKLPASSLKGNKGLCVTKFLGFCIGKGNGHNRHNSLGKVWLIIIPVICTSALLLLVLGTVYYKQCWQKRKQKEREMCRVDCTAALTIQRFDPKDIETATDSFSQHNIIGASNLSTVYKGRLEDGKIVAIKKLNLQQFAAESDKYFNKEAKILSQLRHRNLVKVIGYVWESRILKALVLEYMEHGSLEQIIHSSSVDRSTWTLSKRIDICISIAEALTYLHSDYGFPIIHCDLKPSNILLDEDWQAHVGDFGTARMLGVHIDNGQNISSASAFEGTIGYMAPEFAYMRTVSTKVDIFSFGVIIMELVTKQRPTNLGEENRLPVTLNYIVERAITERKVLQIIDPALLSSITEDQEKAAEELLKLALLCTSSAPEQRPDISPLLNPLKKLNVHQS